LTSEADTMVNRIVQLEASMASQSNDADGVQAELNAEIAALNEQLGSVQSNLDTAVADAEAQQAAMQADTEALNTQLSTLGDEKAALEAQLAGLEDAIGELEGQVSEAQGMTTEKQAELDALNAQTSELDTQLGSMQDSVSQLQERLAGAEKNADEQTAIAQNLANKLAQMQDGDSRQAASAEELKSKIEASLANNGVEDAQVSMRDDNSVVVNLKSEALFSSGRARLTPAGRALMGKVGSALNGMDNNITVEGHTDSIPVSGDLLAIFPSNWELSVARSANTVNYLENSAGIDAQRLSATGFGANRPVATNGTRDGRALNRRVEIVVQP